jgi:HAD superfamily hydrolase (TIGR01549 family)
LYKGIVFDVDGTLVSLKVDGERLRSTTSRELTKFGFDVSFMNEGNMYTQDVIDRARQMVDSGVVKADFSVVRSSLNKALDELEMDWNSQAEPIPGVADVLAGLKSSSVKIATLTNSGRVPSEWLLRKYSLFSYFDFTLTRDDVPAMKPHAEGMLTAISRMNLPKDRVLYVGDSVIDVKAAKKADIKIASVVTGRYAAERLHQEGSDYVLNSLSELSKLV